MYIHTNVVIYTYPEYTYIYIYIISNIIYYIFNNIYIYNKNTYIHIYYSIIPQETVTVVALLPAVISRCSSPSSGLAEDCAACFPPGLGSGLSYTV